MSLVGDEGEGMEVVVVVEGEEETAAAAAAAAAAVEAVIEEVEEEGVVGRRSDFFLRKVYRVFDGFSFLVNTREHIRTRERMN